MPMQEIAATLFILLFACLPLVALCALLIHSPYTWMQSFFCLGANVFVRLQWRGTVPSQLPLDPGQGAVLVCNHRSSVDPFFVQISAHRVVHWMVAKEFCEHPAFRWFLSACEVIPVNRGGIDTASTKQAIRLAAAGGAIGMFPEGRINMTDKFMQPCRPGAVLVALKAQVPLIPVYIDGSPYGGTPWSPFFMRSRVRVHFGKPIHIADYHNDDEATMTGDLMLRTVQAIAELAGHRDYRPQLAGRHWKPTADEVAADREQLESR